MYRHPHGPPLTHPLKFGLILGYSFQVRLIGLRRNVWKQKASIQKPSNKIGSNMSWRCIHISKYHFLEHILQFKIVLSADSRLCR